MDEGIGPTIGQRVTQLRGTTMTQTALAAAAAGVSVDLVRKLEQGRRHTVSIASLHRLARALDVDAGELLSKTTPLPDPGPTPAPSRSATPSPPLTTSSATTPT